MAIKLIRKINNNKFIICSDGEIVKNIEVIRNREYNIFYNIDTEIVSCKAIVIDINDQYITIQNERNQRRTIELNDILDLGTQDNYKKSKLIQNVYCNAGVMYYDINCKKAVLPTSNVIYVDNFSNAIYKYDEEDCRFEMIGEKKSVNMTKKVKYLYYIEDPELDYEFAYKYANAKFRPNYGACSSVRNGNFHGRNYDWYYDETADFVIHTKERNGRNEVIGTASCVKEMTDAFADKGEWDNLYKYIPFSLVDGMNKNGVVCNVNVVPTIDREVITNITGKPGPTVCTSILCRYILDYAQSADDAIDIINNLNIYTINTPGFTQEFHFMISDINKTYVVEFIDNEVVVIDAFVNNKPIMTNFYLNEFTGDPMTIGLHGNGIERYNILSDNYDSATSVSNMASLMQSVYYTKVYDESIEPQWYSEYNGDYTSFGYGDLTIHSSPDDYAPIMEIMNNKYQHRERTRTGPNGGTWQTVHLNIYDMDSLSMRIYVQESIDDYFDFSIAE